MYSISCLRNYINALKRCIDKTCAWIRLVHNSSAEKHSLQSNCTRTNIEIYTQFVQYTFSTANLLMLMIVHNSCLAPSFWNRSLRQCSTEPSLLFFDGCGGRSCGLVHAYTDVFPFKAHECSCKRPTHCFPIATVKLKMI